MAKRKAKQTASKQPKRPRGRPKSPSLATLKAKVKRDGYDSLNKFEQADYEKMISAENRAKVLKLPGVKKGFNISAELSKSIPHIYQALLNEALYGKGIARIAAAKALREWAKEDIIDDGEGVEVSFDITGTGQDELEDAEDAETA